MTAPGPELVAALPPRRVTFAVLASLYDVLPVERRLRIYVASVTWSARATRVESSPVAVGGALYRALHGAVVTLGTGYVEIAEDAARCRWCGCSQSFACAGGCAWVQVDRCSACRDLREEIPSQRLAPGAVTPAAAAALVAARRRGRR